MNNINTYFSQTTPSDVARRIIHTHFENNGKLKKIIALYKKEQEKTLLVFERFLEAIQLKPHAKSYIRALRYVNNDIAKARGPSNFMDCCWNGYLLTAQIMERRHENVEFRTDPNNWTPLHYTVQQGHFDMTKWLISSGSLVDGVAKNGCTPLHIACYQGDMESFMLLIKTRKVDINRKNGLGDTPMHLACFSQNPKIAVILKCLGADASLINARNLKPAAYLKKLNLELQGNLLPQLPKDLNAIIAGKVNPMELVRLKSVSKAWYAFIDSLLLRDLYTNNQVRRKDIPFTENVKNLFFGF